ncbi:hypothetical protein [Litoribacterium kuwaitense]|uniref:hypothetical protein n=1 Tax=Litoribacterium kuwaitense TaxID=1398745 RepID=UPI001FE53863|nr:hypothetical protein [Litoribacterium kuwaitense]
MKVFKMNDIDWVAAETEQEAKEFYAKVTGDSPDDINEFLRENCQRKKRCFATTNSSLTKKQLSD